MLVGKIEKKRIRGSDRKTCVIPTARPWSRQSLYKIPRPFSSIAWLALLT
jgi:hypothetical protein